MAEFGDPRHAAGPFRGAFPPANGQAGDMRTEGPPVIVEPPLDGRRVVIRGDYFGTAYALSDLLRFLWLAGYDAGAVSLTDPAQVEWRGGGPEAW